MHDLITEIIDALPQAQVPILISTGLVLVLTLGSIASALHADTLEMAEGAELRRLTAPLPPAAGRHQFGWATGTTRQRQVWVDDTADVTPAELWEALYPSQPAEAAR